MNQWKPDMTPTWITDDIAYVGGTPVSVHCFICDDGLMLLDTGYPGMLDGIAENMRTLGLDMADVRYILHSHGHIDHYGNTAQIAESTGAKTYISLEDTPIVTGAVDLSWAKELNIPPARTFVPDGMLKEGVLKLGGRILRVVHAPGHTQGTCALFFQTAVNGIPMTAGMHGGVGINSMDRDFLLSRGLPLSLREDFRRGLHRLSAERVDVVLGNHPDQNDTAGKILRMHTGENPFVNKNEWNRFLSACEERLDRMLEKEGD